MNISRHLVGESVVVTGAGRGLGREIALHLARSGADVLAVDRDEDGVVETAGLYPGIARVTCDLRESSAPRAVMQAAREAFGKPLTILVNNAGSGRPGAADATSEAEWDRSMDINLRTIFRMSVAALQDFEVNTGCIVNVASVFGMVGVQGIAAYSAAKAAVIGLTQQMAAEYGPRGVRVNAVAPGLILTPATATPIRDRDPLMEEVMLRRTPMGRVGAPADIASAVAFLASDEASFITGHTLVVDGGWSATHFLATEMLEPEA